MMILCKTEIGNIFLKINSITREKAIEEVFHTYPGVIDIIKIIPYDEYKIKNTNNNGLLQYT